MLFISSGVSAVVMTEICCLFLLLFFFVSIFDDIFYFYFDHFICCLFIYSMSIIKFLWTFIRLISIHFCFGKVLKKIMNYSIFCNQIIKKHFILIVNSFCPLCFDTKLTQNTNTVAHKQQLYYNT